MFDFQTFFDPKLPIIKESPISSICFHDYKSNKNSLNSAPFEPFCISPAVHVSVLMVNGQTRELPLQFAKPRLVCHIGAQQQTAQNISDGDNGGGKKSLGSGVFAVQFHFMKPNSVYSLFVALHPSLTTGVWATVSFHAALRVQLFIAESVCRT